MTQIFLNYRTTDDGFGVALLAEMLSERFGDDAIFLASKSLRLGADWERDMFRAVADSAALLVVMGRGWLSAVDDTGRRRIDDPDDFVRREILTAWELGKQVIPVRLAINRLQAADLPPELHPLLKLQDIEVKFRSHRVDVETLARRLRSQIPALRDQTLDKAADKADAHNVLHANKVETSMQGRNFYIDSFHAGPRTD